MREIAGQKITNIYDYTYALELLKIGQPAPVVYLRNGEERKTTLSPGARTCSRGLRARGQGLRAWRRMR